MNYSGLYWGVRISLITMFTVAIPAYSNEGFNVYWDDGIKIDTPDKNFRFQAGGRIQNDLALFGEEVFGRDDFEFRRARLFVKGLLYNSFEFKVQYDFAGKNPDFKDIYVGLANLDYIGGIRIGQFKEPFSLEEMTSNKYLTFMERSSINVFAPGYNVGILNHNALLDNRISYAIGIFKDTHQFGDDFEHDGFGITGRLTGLPYYINKGEKLIHLGMGFNYKELEGLNDRYRLRVRPESHLADRIINTEFAPFEPQESWAIGGELAGVFGPFSFQSEYMYTVIDQNTFDSADFSGWYVMGSYFLTGEHRAYKTSSGVFGRLRPKHNFITDAGGWGAWELALRYSQLDLQNSVVTVDSGDELDDITVALNWYLNPNTRVMWNYVHAELDDTLHNGEDEEDIFQMRFQVDF